MRAGRELHYSKTLNNRRGALITRRGKVLVVVVLVVLVLGLLVLGVVLLALVAAVACHCFYPC